MKTIVATIDAWCEFEYRIKKASRMTISNCYYNRDELVYLFNKKNCYLNIFEDAAILFVPRFIYYDEILYIATTPNVLARSLKVLQETYPSDRTMTLSIIGKEPSINAMVDVLESLYFTQMSKLGRMILKKPTAKILDAIRDIVAAQDDDHTLIPSFAEEGDAEEVFNFLSREFDICADALPEQDEVLENIRKRQVIIIKDSEKIVCVHYFMIKNHIYYGYFDATDIDYRKKFLFFRIILFIFTLEEDRMKFIVRRYGWRNFKKKSLLRFALHCNQKLDGVLVYHFAWSPSGVMKPYE